MSDKDHPHESCENCKFFHEFERVDLGHLEGMFTRSGKCKRYPPVAVVNNFSDGLECATTIEHEQPKTGLLTLYTPHPWRATTIEHEQPMTEINNWCGEWK